MSENSARRWQCNLCGQIYDEALGDPETSRLGETSVIRVLENVDQHVIGLQQADSGPCLNSSDAESPQPNPMGVGYRFNPKLCLRKKNVINIQEALRSRSSPRGFLDVGLRVRKPRSCEIGDGDGATHRDRHECR